MEDRGKEAPDLFTKDGTVLFTPLHGPAVGIGVAIGSDQRGRDQISHDGVVGAVTFERVDPAKPLLDLCRLEIFSGRAHGIADDAEGETRKCMAFKLAGGLDAHGNLPNRLLFMKALTFKPIPFGIPVNPIDCKSCNRLEYINIYVLVAFAKVYTLSYTNERS